MNLVTGKDNKILRQPTESVEKVTPEIRELIRKMKKTMKESKVPAVGLAAPQIGINKQIFVVELLYDDGEKGPEFAMINPKIIYASKETNTMEEGCLSIPKTYAEVERHKRIVVEFLDEMGRKKKIKASGLLARIFQHEIDHLHGKLTIDSAKNIKEIK